MSPKRKASSLDIDPSTRRRTRASLRLEAIHRDDQAPINTTLSSASNGSGLARTALPPVIKTYGKRPRKALSRATDESSESLGENSRQTNESYVFEDDDDDSEDQLLLSPSKLYSSQPVTPMKNGGQRVFLQAVEIVSPPKRTTRSTQRINAGLPASHHGGNTLKSQELVSEDLLFSSSPAKKQPIARNAMPSSPLEMLSFNPYLATSISAPPSLQKTLIATSRTSSKEIKPHRLPHSHQPLVLPADFHRCLNAQKRAVLRALRTAPNTAYDDHDDENESETDVEPPTNDVALQQLTDLLNGTIIRGEGNSCLLLGPRGSGKTHLVESCLSNLPNRPIVLRLSGWVQHNDRLAMREIARQLTQQTGTSFHSATDGSESDSGDVVEDKEANPFLDVTSPDPAQLTPSSPFLSSPSHLHALITVLPTLSRPTIILLDAFDLFALHAHQSVLYCLLDTVQSCRPGAEGRGVAVIGMTSRVDSVNLLEKRVKSRFSGRVIRTAAPRGSKDWLRLVKCIMCVDADVSDLKEEMIEEWKAIWEASVGNFLADQVVLDVLKEMFGVTRDLRMLSRILTSLVSELSPSSPYPSSPRLISAFEAQCSRPRFSALHTTSYPSICLLIASIHCQTAGHSFITFEMLHMCFREQVRASTSVPIQVSGGNIGMVRCTREVLMSAFEGLISERVFIGITALSPCIAKEFVKYHCVFNREDVKKAVEKMGQTTLKMWLNRAQ